MAETFARLLNTPLADQAVFHMEGHAITGHELVAGLEAAAGRRLAVKRTPWLALAAVAPFNETLRELQEVRYLWRETVLLDNTRLRASLSEEPRTPLIEALRTALAGQGSFPASLIDAA